eukprot:TRINITY_DN1217_c0_g2_i1.p1 TRINITY_DN1217_c0_g2~~TRINITY_DN1217_c0_g2_i1.p1  ORF type:complete len:253 (+),score=10.93 TRINITY_DN1217_c0_g2_i1:747-1505(+)
MKKLMTAFAACMIAGLVSAQVTSQNIVGYHSLALLHGFNMVGVDFQVVGGTTTSEITIDEFIDSTNLTAGEDDSNSDLIYVYRNGDYLPTYFLLDAGDGLKVWYDADSNPAGTLRNGDGVWIKILNPVGVNVTMAGQVPSAATAVKINHGVFNMVANPFPMEWDLTSTTMVNWNTLVGPVAGEDDSNSDLMYVYSLTTGDYLPTYFLLDAGDGVRVWYDADSNLPVPLAPGQGFWYYSRGSSDFDITFAKTF